ncbi:hypothetical protein ABEW19_28010 [Paenibacillus illinoisensis]|uniref:hypothetical protein n=1 Tax=Paenibacillus illinoisensis TaxID=59845 RepID=UPI003D28A93F
MNKSKGSFARNMLLFVVLFLILLAIRGCQVIFDNREDNRIIQDYEKNDKAIFETSLYSVSTYEANLKKQYSNLELADSRFCTSETDHHSYEFKINKENICVSAYFNSQEYDPDVLQDGIYFISVSFDMETDITDEWALLVRNILLSIERDISVTDIKSAALEFKNKVNQAHCKEVRVQVGNQYFNKWHNYDCDPYTDFMIQVLDEDLADRARKYFDILDRN